MPARSTIWWLLAYLAAMTLVVAGLIVVRQRTLARLGTPQARRQWQQWKQQTAQQQTAGPVRRRPVTSDEPPALVLLRDRFVAIVVTTVMICSFLFAFLAFAARGAAGSRKGQP